MINKTNDLIRYTSFMFFLERGYESTNIRDICKKVNIKPSSLYFYYNSKQELFFSIYDGIRMAKIEHMKKVEELDSCLSPEIKFYSLFKNMIEYYAQDIVRQKFLLRYHLFPAEEILIPIRDRFKYWEQEENEVVLDIIKQCIDQSILDAYEDINEYLQTYKRFEQYQITDMIISNIKINPKELEMLWDRFWNCDMLNRRHKACNTSFKEE